MLHNDHTKKFYVTTPIYYVNAAPHLGTLYSTLLADVAARYHKIMGDRVFFLTGTDEHGQKIADAAKKVDKQPKEFVDQFIPAYQNMWKLYNIDYTKFIRTTDQSHMQAVQDWILKLIEQGDIYKGTYTGWYCTPCETFITQKDQQQGTAEVTCPSCARPCNQISEPCYFFKLSAYQDKILTFLEKHPEFITPKERAHEVIAFLKEGLKDLSISRTTVKWGIPFPGDNLHVTYVWADALNNYITAIGYNPNHASKDFNYWWPADLQVLGKDILRFHAIYWPAFLMASGLALPKKLLVHGWITVGDQKMSKSLGNAVDPKALVETYGVDQIRYYLIRKMAVTHDGQFSVQDIEQCINADLANDVGNLLSRVTTLAEKYNYIHVQAPEKWSKHAQVLHDACQKMMQETIELVHEGLLHRALQCITEYVAMCNAYFHHHEPWKKAQTDQAAFQEIIAVMVYSLRTIGYLLWPVMPNKMQELLASVQVVNITIESDIPLLKNLSWTDQVTIKKIDNLFKKYEKIMEKQENNGLVAAQTPCATIEDFAKIEMRVGQIIACEYVEKSDKLLKMQVDFGTFGKRQIFSGMRKHFTPDDLIGKQAVFVVNFKPRMIMGMPSEGMMLTADDAVITTSKNIELGALIK